MDRKIADLTVDEFTELIENIIDRRIDAVLDDEGELREDFVRELKNRLKNPDLVDFNEVWD